MAKSEKGRRYSDESKEQFHLTTNHKSFCVWSYLCLTFTFGISISGIVTSTSSEKFAFLFILLIVMAVVGTINFIFSSDDSPVTADFIIDFNIKAFIVGKQKALIPFVRFDEISLKEPDWLGYGSRCIVGTSRYGRKTYYGPFVLSTELTDRLERISADLYNIDEKAQGRHLNDKSADLQNILNSLKLKPHWRLRSAWKQVDTHRYYGLTTTANEGTTIKMIHWDENVWCLTSFSQERSGSDLREWWSAL